MPYSNSPRNLSIAQEIYDNLSPYQNETPENDLLDSDKETLLKLAYEYIENQELTSKDIEQLDKAILDLPELLENVNEWNKKREDKKKLYLV